MKTMIFVLSVMMLPLSAFADLTPNCKASLERTAWNKTKTETWISENNVSEAEAAHWRRTVVDLEDNTIDLCVQLNLIEIWFWESPERIARETAVEARDYYDSLLGQ